MVRLSERHVVVWAEWSAWAVCQWEAISACKIICITLAFRAKAVPLDVSVPNQNLIPCDLLSRIPKASLGEPEW
jgi:hypothetical protein